MWIFIVMQVAMEMDVSDLIEQVEKHEKSAAIISGIQT